MKKITKHFWMLCIGVLWQPLYAQPDTEPVPIHFSITGTGINRFIADQWSSVTHTWAGTYQGMNYDLDLKRPVVDLSENTFRITLEVDIFASVSGAPIFDETVSFSPELTIPVTTINPDSVIEDVKAAYIDLEAVIDGIPIITDQRIRDVLEDKMDNIEWVIYQGELLSQTTLRWSDLFDVGFYGLPEVSFSVGNGVLVLTVLPKVYGNEPEYQFQFRRTSSVNYQVRVLSNNEISFQSFKATTTLGYNFSQDISANYSFDSSLNKYIATYSFSGPSANTVVLICHFRLMRAGMETVWSGTVNFFGTTSNWTTTSSIAPVWGE